MFQLTSGKVIFGIMVALFSNISLTSSFSTTTSNNSNNSKKKLPAAILFDIDGTLVNSDPIHFDVFRELLLKEDGFNNNVPINEEFFRKYIAGRQNALIMEDFFPQWSISQRESWSIMKEARFREVAQGTTMKQSKMKGLDKLRNWIDSNNIRKAAVTNAPRLNAEAILSGIGYEEWFSKDAPIIIGDECEKPKPDPCPYLTACQLLQVNPEDCIVFEDSPSGAKAGVAAGAYVIGILSGQEEITLQNAGCSLIIKNFEDPKLWNYLDEEKMTTTATSAAASTSSQ